MTAIHRQWRLSSVSLACGILATCTAFAQKPLLPQQSQPAAGLSAAGAPYTPPSFFPPVPNGYLPAPDQVVGKEYSDRVDVDCDAVTPRPGQVVLWDGQGGVMNGPVVGIPGAAFQVDAMANVGDVLFDAVVANQAHLLISVEGDSANNSIWYETMGGGRGVWAAKNQVNQNGVRDLDGLEVWGPEGASDTTHVSYALDPGGVAVFTSAGAPVVSDVELALAIGLSPNYVDLLDLDALMMNSDALLFSIQPVIDPASGGVLFDGGEIWSYTIGSFVPASFLNHGGHLWDTAFDVRGAFGVDSENVDALEAVSVIPEAGTWIGGSVLVGWAALTLLRRRNAAAQS